MASDDKAKVDHSLMLEGGDQTEEQPLKIELGSNDEVPASEKKSDPGDDYFKEVVKQKPQLLDEVIKECNFIGEQIIEFEEDIRSIDVALVGEDKQLVIV